MSVHPWCLRGASLGLALALAAAQTGVAQVEAHPWIVPRSLQPDESGSRAFSAVDPSGVRWFTAPLPQTPATERHKSPVLAWFLSWLVPGGGQGYNGQWGKAAGFFGVAVAGLALAASNGGFDCSPDCGSAHLGIGLLAVSSIGSQIEAPITAAAINRRATAAAVSSVPRVTVTLATLHF